LWPLPRVPRVAKGSNSNLPWPFNPAGQSEAVAGRIGPGNEKQNSPATSMAEFPETLAGRTGGSKPARIKAEPEVRRQGGTNLPPAPRAKPQSVKPALIFQGGPANGLGATNSSLRQVYRAGRAYRHYLGTTHVRGICVLRKVSRSKIRSDSSAKGRWRVPLFQALDSRKKVGCADLPHQHMAPITWYYDSQQSRP
jgi:hypothetical protein